jgi:hypothetical protein
MSLVHRFAQRGAALVVSLIMLVLITLLVITALNLGSLGFRSVSNTQFRDEAIAAANVAIQQVISSPFYLEPEEADEDINVDLDNSGGDPDYVVSIGVPECIFVSEASEGKASSIKLPPTMTSGSTWNSVWDIEATVAPASNAGEASVRIRTGVRVLLNQTQRDDVCP